MVPLQDQVDRVLLRYWSLFIVKFVQSRNHSWCGLKVLGNGLPFPANINNLAEWSVVMLVWKCTAKEMRTDEKLSWEPHWHMWKLWARTAEKQKLSNHLKAVTSFIYQYRTMQSWSRADQCPREILSSNGKISPAHKIAFENWIFLSTLPVEVRLQNSFLLHNLYWKCPREGPQGQLRGEQIDCGIWEILNYNWNNPKLENFCKRGLNITRKRHQLQLNCSTAERANSPAQWEKCKNDDWAEIHSIFLEK